METATETPTAAQVARACIDKHGLTVTAEFVPWSRSRSKDEKQTDSSGKPTKWPRYSLNWRVTLAKKGRAILSTDYGAGSGHCPSYKAKGLGIQNSVMREEFIIRECETGKASHAVSGTILSGAPILPDAADVIYSLALDASVLDSGGFESWAGDFGYDTDSRKAEKIYQQCLEIALQMRAGLGDVVLSELREAFQDY